MNCSICLGKREKNWIRIQIKSLILINFGESPLIEPHVVFRRNSNMYCVYCGDKADTREHCPSKAFLNKPYPTDLPTVPACKQCNNGFSADERYTSAYINYLYEYYENSNIDIFSSGTETRRENADARRAVEKFVKLLWR